MGSVLTLSSPLAFPHPLMEGVYLGVKTCEVFLCSGVIVYLLYIVSRFIVVLVVLCFTSLVSFTGFYTEDEPMEAQKYYSLLKTHFKKTHLLCAEVAEVGFTVCFAARAKQCRSCITYVAKVRPPLST